MNDYQFPVIGDPKNKEIAILSNIKKIELAEYYLRHHFEGAHSTQEELDDVYPLQHFIANGTYSRQIFLPSGHIVIGKVHNYEHTSILSKGSVTILTPEGKEHREAPEIWVSPKGTKRLIYVHTDTIWTTIHRTLLKDPAQIVLKISHDSNLSWVLESNLLESIL
jgi:hypothetical protein